MDIPEDWGLPANEALKAFADPDLMTAYERENERFDAVRRSKPVCLPDGRKGWMRPTSGAEGQAFRRATRNAKAAMTAVIDDFMAKLVSGEVVATGLPVPDTLDGQRVVVPVHKWSTLRIVFRTSRAKGLGLELASLRFGQRAEATFLTAGEMDEGVPGAVGRRSLMHVANSFLERRAAAGKLERTLERQSIYLSRCLSLYVRRHMALGIHVPHPPKPKSIANSIRTKYRQLKN